MQHSNTLQHLNEPLYTSTNMNAILCPRAELYQLRRDRTTVGIAVVAPSHADRSARV